MSDVTFSATTRTAALHAAAMRKLACLREQINLRRLPVPNGEVAACVRDFKAELAKQAANGK